MPTLTKRSPHGSVKALLYSLIPGKPTPVTLMQAKVLEQISRRFGMKVRWRTVGHGAHVCVLLWRMTEEEAAFWKNRPKRPKAGQLISTHKNICLPHK